MLTADQLDVLPGPILALYERFHISVIRDIARRLSNLDFASAAWQMQRMIEAGRLYEDILAELARITGYSETVLRRIFQEAGVTALRFDDSIYKAAGLDPLPLNLSPALTEALVAGLRRTAGLMKNLVQTTAISCQESFIAAADLAYMQVSTGAFDYNTAIREAVKQVASDGLEVIHYSGKHDKLDVAMRRAVLTGVNQTVGEMQIARADEMGTDLVQTTAHIGARNKGDVPENHELWQGRIFSRHGDPGYPDFVTVTGYGTIVGLCGINCRHNFYPFFKGISESAYSQSDLQQFASKTVTYNGREMSFYDATQEQRRIERAIRKAKREASALEAAGLDNILEKAKIKALQARMRSFIKQTGLQRQYVREQIVKPENISRTVGFSFLSGESHLTTTEEARTLGESAEGWDKHEQIFREQYLERFELEDDVDQTLGFWGGPEPSFNAHVTGTKANVIRMSGAWGNDFNQQAMALLLPNQGGTGGRLVWEFGRELTDQEMDSFFQILDGMSKELEESGSEYVGVTVKDMKTIEHWFSDTAGKGDAFTLIRTAVEGMNIEAKFHGEIGYDFILLFKGDDY